jgi:hypothetical protein
MITELQDSYFSVYNQYGDFLAKGAILNENFHVFENPELMNPYFKGRALLKAPGYPNLPPNPSLCRTL